MSHHKTMELYNQIGTQEKRAVNRLLQAFASALVKAYTLRIVTDSVTISVTEPCRIRRGVCDEETDTRKYLR
jgi:hypothetical protein